MLFSQLKAWRESSSIYLLKQRLLGYKLDEGRDHIFLIIGSLEQM